MMSPTVIRGSSEEYGSWNTICILLRRYLISALLLIKRSLKIISPPVGLYKCMMDRPTVVFPQPDSPTRPRVSPFLIENVTPSTAFNCFEENRPEFTLKYIFKSLTVRRYLSSIFIPPPSAIFYILPERSSSRKRSARRRNPSLPVFPSGRSSSRFCSAVKMHSLPA